MIWSLNKNNKLNSYRTQIFLSFEDIRVTSKQTAFLAHRSLQSQFHAVEFHAYGLVRYGDACYVD